MHAAFPDCALSVSQTEVQPPAAGDLLSTETAFSGAGAAARGVVERSLVVGLMHQSGPVVRAGVGAGSTALAVVV